MHLKYYDNDVLEFLWFIWMSKLMYNISWVFSVAHKLLFIQGKPYFPWIDWKVLLLNAAILLKPGE